jgi:SAM-dependent methyltransferase
MPDREIYQHGFSRIHPGAVYNLDSRTRKARTIMAVLNHYDPNPCENFSLLDIGCSTGIIAHFLSDFFGQVLAVDIDEEALRHAKSHFSRPNLLYSVQDSLRIACPNETFDRVICAQVYEHVPDAERLMAEIHRVLKPGGLCYFAAGNRLAVMEPHYRLPFLSWLPQIASDAYLRASGKGPVYYEKHRTLWGLKRLARCFSVIDYTVRLVDNPDAFELGYLLQKGSLRHRLAKVILRRFYWLCPTYIWLLRKPRGPREIISTPGSVADRPGSK